MEVVIRFIIVATLFAIPAGLIIWLLIKESEHRAKRKRVEKYNEWVKTLPSMSEFDRTLAQAHMVRILKEGPQGSYRGPWENS